MSLVFIRHLPTAYNQQNLLQGLRDEPILPTTSELDAVIASNQRQLNSMDDFSKIFCSPLRRTKESAMAYGYRAQIEPLLMELDFGRYEAKPRQTLMDEVGEQWLNDPSHLALGEPIADLLTRVQAFMIRYENEHILSFAHGAWMRAARAWHEESSLDSMNQITIANNALLIIEPL